MRKRLLEYGVAVVAVAVAACARWLLDPLFGERFYLPTFFIAVAMVVWYGGYRPALVTIALSLVVIHVMLNEPRGVFGSLHGDVAVAQVIFLVTSLFIVGFGAGMRSAQQSAEANWRRAVESERELAAELSATKRLHELGVRLWTKDDLAAILREVLKASVEWLGAAKGNIQLYDEEEEVLKIVAHLGFSQEFLDEFKSVPIGYSVCGEALRRGERVICEDAAADPRFAEWAPKFARHGFVAVQSTPLFRSDGQLLGMLSSHFARPHRPSESELRMLDLYAQQAERLIELKRVEDALRASEARLDYALEATTEGVWDWNLQTGSVVFSRHWIESLGYSPEEVTPHVSFWKGLVHPEDWPRLQEALEAHFAGQTPIYSCENRLRTKSGAYRWNLDRGKVVEWDADGKPLRMVGTDMDITERRQQEEALKDADRRKDEFLATLAHELRNPLAPIRNGVELLRMIGRDDPEFDNVRNMLDRQVRQMSRLIDDLLDVSRITRGTFELRRQRVELAAVVASAVETSRPLIDGAGHELTVALSPEPIYVEADLTRLAQVFSNLLNNAAKYSERGGRVSLTAQREDGRAVVRVSDTGIGIPQELLPRVFEMFMQVDRSLERTQGGLGIGLTLVKQLVELHGGTVEVHSDGSGLGSEFIVRLPVASAPQGEPPKSDPGPVAAPARLRVLIVDDNQDAATSLCMMLDRAGYETRTARDGFEALAVATAFRPHVGLVDIGMPHMNGYDVARRLREQPWADDLVLFAVTGWGQPEDRERSAQAGFDHHLVKPVNIAMVLDLLAQTSGRLQPAGGEA